MELYNKLIKDTQELFAKGSPKTCLLLRFV